MMKPRTTEHRFFALDAARALAILHMVWFHAHRWAAPESSIQRWPYSLDWWSLAVLSAPPLFFLCFGCAVGMQNWETDYAAKSRRLLRRAVELLVAYKLLFLLEMCTLGLPAGSIWQGLTYQRTSSWVEVLDFYSLAMLTLPLLLPLFLRLPWLSHWLLFAVSWSTALWIRSWPVRPETAVLRSFFVELPGTRPFAYLFWMPIVLIGISLGRCWLRTPERFGRMCLVQGLLLGLGVGWFGEGGFTLQEFHLGVVLNGWKHPPHLAYVGLTSVNALVWLYGCTRFYGLARGRASNGGRLAGSLARIGRHPMTVYRGHFLFLFWLNGWASIYGQMSYPDSLALATLLAMACFPFCRWLESPGPAWNRLSWRANLAVQVLVLAVALFWVRPVRTALSAEEFQGLVTALSERGEDFVSDNWVSNESAMLHVLDRLHQEVPPGCVYLGVGPEQNFTYIAELRPAYAFIVDIRRGNMLQHLYYKALFELCPTPEEWLCALLSRPLSSRQSQQDFADWVHALAASPPGENPVRRQALIRMEEDGFEPTATDRAYLEQMLRVFRDQGLSIRFTFRSSETETEHPSFEQMLLLTDLHGKMRNFLAVPSSYARVRQMQRENRIIPVVGDFAGSRALSGIAAEVRRRHLLVGMFYLSNVESYLMPQAIKDDAMTQFVTNLEALPSDEKTVLLRTHRRDIRNAPPYRYGPEHHFVPKIQRLQRFVRRYQAGRMRYYSDCMLQDALPLEVDGGSDLGGND